MVRFIKVSSDQIILIVKVNLNIVFLGVLIWMSWFIERDRVKFKFNWKLF